MMDQLGIKLPILPPKQAVATLIISAVGAEPQTVTVTQNGHAR